MKMAAKNGFERSPRYGGVLLQTELPKQTGGRSVVRLFYTRDGLTDTNNNIILKSDVYRGWIILYRIKSSPTGAKRIAHD